MIYYAREGQTSYGEAIGILSLDATGPRIPGDVGNATTYQFPVKFKKVEGLTTDRAVGKDLTAYDILLESAKELQSQGVRAVTSECGFLGIHQKKLANALDIPVLLSSLLQIPFLLSFLGADDKLGIITANSNNLDDSLLSAVGVYSTENIVIEGLENEKNFSMTVLEEAGFIYPDRVQQEVVSVAKKLVSKIPLVKVILLECSILPPYSAAVQKATNLPVYDFITMINFAYSGLLREEYKGFI